MPRSKRPSELRVSQPRSTSTEQTRWTELFGACSRLARSLKVSVGWATSASNTESVAWKPGARRSLRSVVDSDVLDIEVLLHPRAMAFAAVARLLDAAEGRLHPSQ